MRTPKRIQRKRAKGWRMPPFTVFVGRPGLLGNPYLVERWGREKAVLLYRLAGDGSWDPSALADLSNEDYHEVYVARQRWHARVRARTNLTPKEWAQLSLGGSDVACWCPLDESCHADVLLEWANPKGGGNLS